MGVLKCQRPTTQQKVLDNKLKLLALHRPISGHQPFLRLTANYRSQNIDRKDGGSMGGSLIDAESG